jgi:hypothetical protein
MNEPSQGPEWLSIQGMKVHRSLLEAHPVRRCRIEECQAKCCAYEVWVNVEQVDDILAHAELIQPHLQPDRRDPVAWFDPAIEQDENYPGGRRT